MFDAIMDALSRELMEYNEKFNQDGARISTQDLDIIDKLTHAMKCLATYEAMEGSYCDTYERKSSRDRVPVRRQVEYGRESDPHWNRRS